MMRVLSVATAVSALLLTMVGVSPAYAQDAPTPTRFENVDWGRVVFVDYHAGKRDRALEIIEAHFIPAAEKAELSLPIMVELMSGPWDTMMLWSMPEGPAEMTWERSPNGMKWWQALVELTGGEEEAQKIDEEYNRLVARTTSYIGFSGRHGMRLAGN